MIVYIHGFNSSGYGSTATELKKYFPDLVTPTYDALKPCETIKMLLELDDSASDDEDIVLIASSLGGWFAEKIASLRSVDLVLFNPSLEPHTSLKKYNVDTKILDSYHTLALSEPRNSVRRHVILCEDDEVVPYWKAKEKYHSVASITYTTGGHVMNAENMKIVKSKVEYLINSF
jgi:predicted esterase YcpF (UPF0227 family)